MVAALLARMKQGLGTLGDVECDLAHLVVRLPRARVAAVAIKQSHVSEKRGKK